MKKELNYYDIHVKVMRREKLTLEEKKIHFEKMVYKNNLIETLFKKDEERAKKFKEWQELLKEGWKLDAEGNKYKVGEM